MRTTLTLLLVAISFTATAQNWALLNPANKYNYSLGGTDTITDQVFIARIDTLGADSFRYQLNTIAERCDTCMIGYTAICWAWGGAWVRSGVPTFMGSEVQLNDGTWMLQGQDTLILHPEAGVGASWIGPSSVVATVVAVEENILFGIADSLKWIAFSTGDTVTLSRDHGLVRWRSPNSDAYQLIGMQGSLQHGERFPDMSSLFNYGPGDVLQYENAEVGSDPNCYHDDHDLIKYTFLTRTDNAEETVYSVRRVASYDHLSFQIGGQGPCTSYYGTEADTIELIITHDRWTPTNFLGNSWLDHCWPKAFAKRAVDDNMSQYSTVLRANLDDQQRYVLEPDTVSGSMGSHLLLCLSYEDTAVWAASDNYVEYATYVDGIGLTHYEWVFTEHQGTRDLVGYMINGEQWGTITPDDIILGTNERMTEPGAILSPNPADDHLIVSGASPGVAFAITDLQGRILGTGSINSTNERIAVGRIPPGIYLFHAEGHIPQRFLIAR